MKRLSAIAVFAVMLFACSVFLCDGGTAYAGDNAFDVISPDLSNYLYMDTPALSAIDGDTVAVYDTALNKIFVAGDSRAEYDVTLRSDESVIKLAFANGKLYYLTNRSLLYCVTDSTEIAIGRRVFRAMTTDGNKLYFYNGNLSVYAYDGVDFTEYFDYEYLIIGAKSFCVLDNAAYLILKDSVYKFDFSTEKATVAFSTDATEIMTVQNGLFTMSDDTATYCDVNGVATGDELALINVFSAADGILDISTDGTFFAVLSGGDKAVYKYSHQFALLDMFGCASEKAGWYNNPQTVANTADGAYAIWDKDNARVEVVKNLGESTESRFYVNFSRSFNFDRFAASGNNAVFEKNGNLYYTSLINATTTANFVQLSTGLNVGAMAVSGNVVFVYDKTTNSVYTADFTADSPIFKIFCYCPLAVTGLTLRGNSANPVLYAKSADGICTLTTIGRGDDFITAANVIDFTADYVGNVYALSKIGDDFVITKYASGANGFSADGIVTLSSADFSLANVGSFAIDYLNDGNGVLAVDSSKNILIKINGLSFINKSSFVQSAVPQLADTVAEDVTFVKSMGTAVYNYTDNNNLLTGVANAGEVLTVLVDTTDYYFVLTQSGSLGYVPKAATGTAAVTETSGTVIALHDTINVYNAPTTDAVSTPFDKQQVFALVNDCATFNNGNDWYKVSYTAGGNTYYGFVLKSRVMTHTVVPVIEEAVYAKAKSLRIGAKVNVYAMADAKSSVVTTVTDGEKVKLLEDYNGDNEFTLVEYNGVTGYVYTAELLLTNGLTAGQIAAIVLAAAILLITLLYVLISIRNKKLSAKQK